MKFCQKLYHNKFLKLMNSENYWLDQDGALTRLTNLHIQESINQTEHDLCLNWIKYGYVILEQHFSEDILDTAWAEYDQKLATDEITAPEEKNNSEDILPGRTLNPHLKVEGFRDVMSCMRLLKIFNLILNSNVIPFQSIASHKGSQQKLHSDAIHMTTDPLGGLVAAWVAFEDIDEDSGPLEFCPSSHRLPYILSNNLDIDPKDFKENGYSSYHQKYEPAIESVIGAHNIKKRIFLAKKGDVLI